MCYAVLSSLLLADVFVSFTATPKDMIDIKDMHESINYKRYVPRVNFRVNVCMYRVTARKEDIYSILWFTKS